MAFLQLNTIFSFRQAKCFVLNSIINAVIFMTVRTLWEQNHAYSGFNCGHVFFDVP